MPPTASIPAPPPQVAESFPPVTHGVVIACAPIPTSVLAPPAAAPVFAPSPAAPVAAPAPAAVGVAPTAEGEGGHASGPAVARPAELLAEHMPPVGAVGDPGGGVGLSAGGDGAGAAGAGVGHGIEESGGAPGIVDAVGVSAVQGGAADAVVAAVPGTVAVGEGQVDGAAGGRLPRVAGARGPVGNEVAEVDVGGGEVEGEFIDVFQS